MTIEAAIKTIELDVSEVQQEYRMDFAAAFDVAIMMALLKIARISENPQHMDSWVDGCGYFSCGGEIVGKEAQE